MSDRVTVEEMVALAADHHLGGGPECYDALAAMKRLRDAVDTIRAEPDHYTASETWDPASPLAALLSAAETLVDIPNKDTRHD